MSELAKHDLAAAAERYSQAWSSHDPAAIVALHAPESAFQAHGRGAEVTGTAALLKEFAQVFQRYPEFGVETRRLLLGESHWVLDYTLTFQPAGAERRGFHALDIVEVDNAGLVTRKDTFFNYAEVKAAMEPGK